MKKIDKWLNSDERAEKHQMVYEDQLDWIQKVYESEIQDLCSMEIVVVPYYYRDYPKVIEGALVSLIMQTNMIDSETIRHILHVLGSDRFNVIRGGGGLILKVYSHLCNNARTSMLMCGMWTPKWLKEDEQEKK